MLGASRKASEQSRYDKCHKKGRNSGADRPDEQGGERRSWTACCGEQPVNVRCERKAESPERDRPRRMPRRCARRGIPLMFVSNLYRGHDGAGHPRGQPPQAHVMGVGEHTESDAMTTYATATSIITRTHERADTSALARRRCHPADESTKAEERNSEDLLFALPERPSGARADAPTAATEARR